MTISEEIEQLKLKLEKTTDERERLKILLEILRSPAIDGSDKMLSFIEECKTLVSKIGDKTQQALLLTVQGRYELNNSNHAESISFYEQAVKLYEEMNDVSGTGSVYMNIGLCYQNQSKYPRALEYYQMALKIREQDGDQLGLGKVLQNIGNTFFRQGNFLKSLEYHFRVLKIMENVQNRYGIGGSLLNIGNVHLSEKRYSQAREYYLQAKEIMEECGNRYGILSCYLNIGSTYSDEKNFEEGLRFYLQSLKLIESLGDKYALASFYLNIGIIYYGQKDTMLALDYFAKALEYAEEGKLVKRICEVFIVMGIAYTTLGNREKANENLMNAERLAKESGDTFEQCAALHALYEMYKSFNEPALALEYYEKQVELKSELSNKESTEKIASLQITYDLEKKQKEAEIEHLRNVELKKERDLSESLLLNILPAEVAEELKSKGTADAKLFDDVTVLYTDFKSFTTVTERLSPQQLVDELNICFSAFDEIMGRYNIEKIKTVGDAYLAVSGLPLAKPNHASDVVNAAIEIRQFIKERVKLKGKDTFDIRIGVHSGSVVAGIVGVKKYAYDIWGDTVNTAARMEQSSEVGKINISEATHRLVKDHFKTEYRGEIEAKNKGKLKMYFVVG